MTHSGDVVDLTFKLSTYRVRIRHGHWFSLYKNYCAHNQRHLIIQITFLNRSCFLVSSLSESIQSHKVRNLPLLLSQNKQTCSEIAGKAFSDNIIESQMRNE